MVDGGAKASAKASAKAGVGVGARSRGGGSAHAAHSAHLEVIGVEMIRLSGACRNSYVETIIKGTVLGLGLG